MDKTLVNIIGIGALAAIFLYFWKRPSVGQALYTYTRATGLAADVPQVSYDSTSVDSYQIPLQPMELLTNLPENAL